MSKVISVPLKNFDDENKEVIIVEIGSNKFEVPIDLGSVENLATKMIEVGKTLEAFDETNIDEVKKGLKLAYKTIFGKGSFKKVYQESGGSLIVTMNALYVSLEQITKAIQDLTPNFQKANNAAVLKVHGKKKDKKKLKATSPSSNKKTEIIANTNELQIFRPDSKENACEEIVGRAVSKNLSSY